jgi:tetratricopeptide (TPR) repeat protein
MRQELYLEEAVAESTGNLAIALTYGGNYEEAEGYHQRAMDLWEQLVRDAAAYNRRERQVNLAVCITNFGYHLRKVGRIEEAKGLYLIALRELEPLPESAGHHEMLVLAHVLNNLGALNEAKHSIEAEVCYKRAADLFRALHGPKHEYYRSALGGMLRIRSWGLSHAPGLKAGDG